MHVHLFTYPQPPKPKPLKGVCGATGAILGTMTGTPSIAIATDMRILELMEAMHMPYLPLFDHWLNSDFFTSISRVVDRHSRLNNYGKHGRIVDSNRMVQWIDTPCAHCGGKMEGPLPPAPTQLVTDARAEVAAKLAELVGRVSTKLFDGNRFDQGRMWAAQRFTRLFRRLGVPVHPDVLALAGGYRWWLAAAPGGGR